MQNESVVVSGFPAVTCSHVETSYISSLSRPILSQVNCTINSGEFVALLGLNGAGKSTLLRAMVGLVPLQQGEIRIHDTKVANRTLSHIRRDVAFLCQGGGLVRQLSALDNVLCGCLGDLPFWQTLWGFPLRDRTLALNLLEFLGLQEFADRKTGQLSGGQQQRVAIARALVRSPQILLADEPISGLDVVGVQQVMDSLAQLHRDRGMTVIVVLHDLAIAANYADRAIVMDAGKIVYDGSCQNIESKFCHLQTKQISQPAHLSG